jgi:DNA-binding transcriptional MerR regulator
MEFSSKQIADLVGVTVRTLRHYHQIGLLPEPERTSGGYRIYTADHVLQLLRIKRLTGLGLTLDQVSQVLGDPASPAAEKTLADLDQALADAISEMRAQRRTIAAMRQAEAAVDVLPEFAHHIAKLRALGADAKAIAADKMLIEIIAGLGTGEDVEKLQDLLNAVLTDPQAQHFAELDTQLQQVDDGTAKEEVAQLALDWGQALIAFYDTYTQEPGKAERDWSSDNPIDQILSSLAEAELNPQQRAIIKRATTVFEAHVRR